MPEYTINYLANPSFEVSLQGYVNLTGTTSARITNLAQFGSCSMEVTTDGVTAGEGFYSPTATIPSTSICTASIYLMGTGDNAQVTISAVTTGGSVLQVATVTLPTQFTRFSLPGLSVTGTNIPLYILVQTPSSTATTFWADALQIEPSSSPTPYCDGSIAGCFWDGTAGLSTSYRPYAYGAQSTSPVTVSGTVAGIIPGEVFQGTPEVTVVTISDIVTGSVDSPVAAFDDFGIYELTDPDPAQTYTWWNNAGVMTGYSNYNTGYGMFVPPRDYIVSDGSYLWRRAAFAAVGFTFVNMIEGQQANITNVQVEYPQLNGTTAVLPRPFQTPRTIQCIVKPDRMNFVPNPSFETSLYGWLTSDAGLVYGAGLYGEGNFGGLTGGTVAISQVTSPAPPNVGSLGNISYSAGSDVMQVVIDDSDTDQAVLISIPNLIVGRNYIASAYIQPGTGISDVELTIANGQGLASNAGTGFGTPGYGGGFFGGLPATSTQLPIGSWYRAYCLFTAAADTQVLTLSPILIPSVSYPASFWVDSVLVEEGQLLQPYFDGNFGTDCLWENGGVPNLCRSYYYEQLRQSAHLVSDVLSKNTPLGVLYSTPLFATPYTQ